MALRKTYCTITLDQTRNFYESIPADQQAEEYPFLTPIIEDKLFLSTGFEQDQMEAAILSLKLDEDKEYQEMERECMEAARKIIQEVSKKK